MMRKKFNDIDLSINKPKNEKSLHAKYIGQILTK